MSNPSEVYNDREKAEQAERKRLQLLAQSLDPVTIRRLAQLQIQPGWHCLEVGAGAGSIAQWLTKQAGFQGHVVATDIDTRFLDNMDEPSLEIRRHDILTDELETQAYDLVHTRAVLMHLSDPVQAVKKMAEAVRPGGWLLLEEFDWISFGAVDTENQAAQTFNQKMETLARELRNWHVMNLYLGRQLRRMLEQLAFVDIGIEGNMGISRGGDPLPTQFQLMNLQLAGPPFIAAGIWTEQDLELLQRLFADPSFYYVDGTFFGAWGRHPV